ncbi:hypothetical protein SARC_07876 [Sphaeroforma arctica JP610]|uniref:Uncharacterized protein n=1 Tax=Sphaeroforma arctica JP610 TaxID=667725 RepID=A0A0L0FSG0_9EUKA|nr:hypothetical protein SARC_07876 [Sphaeroforma arctica JP610]KNC79737.1 hypothetical protein SARC_07876 [Sphaeroforma arctica JP610]|eukprot:XP_014153639.1 hypothetical protein SARC_07876 [Sphaeroforma arctica JP610]
MATPAVSAPMLGEEVTLSDSIEGVQSGVYYKESYVRQLIGDIQRKNAAIDAFKDDQARGDVHAQNIIEEKLLIVRALEGELARARQEVHWLKCEVSVLSEREQNQRATVKPLADANAEEKKGLLAVCNGDAQSVNVDVNAIVDAQATASKGEKRLEASALYPAVYDEGDDRDVLNTTKPGLKDPENSRNNSEGKAMDMEDDSVEQRSDTQGVFLDDYFTAHWDAQDTHMHADESDATGAVVAEKDLGRTKEALVRKEEDLSNLRKELADIQDQLEKEKSAHRHLQFENARLSLLGHHHAQRLESDDNDAEMGMDTVENTTKVSEKSDKVSEKSDNVSEKSDKENDAGDSQRMGMGHWSGDAFSSACERQLEEKYSALRALYDNIPTTLREANDKYDAYVRQTKLEYDRLKEQSDKDWKEAGVAKLLAEEWENKFRILEIQTEKAAAQADNAQLKAKESDESDESCARATATATGAESGVEEEGEVDAEQWKTHNSDNRPREDMERKHAAELKDRDDVIATLTEEIQGLKTKCADQKKLVEELDWPEATDLSDSMYMDNLGQVVLLAKKEQDLEAAHEKLKKQSKRMKDLEKQLTTTCKQLEAKDKALSARDVVIKTQAERIEANDERIKVKDEEIRKKDAIVGSKDDEIGKKDAIIRNKEKEIRVLETDSETIPNISAVSKASESGQTSNAGASISPEPKAPSKPVSTSNTDSDEPLPKLSWKGGSVKRTHDASTGVGSSDQTRKSPLHPRMPELRKIENKVDSRAKPSHPSPYKCTTGILPGPKSAADKELAFGRWTPKAATTAKQEARVRTFLTPRGTDKPGFYSNNNHCFLSGGQGGSIGAGTERPGTSPGRAASGINNFNTMLGRRAEKGKSPEPKRKKACQEFIEID